MSAINDLHQRTTAICDLIGEALAMLRDTRWPRDEDYDALEREHNAARE